MSKLISVADAITHLSSHRPAWPTQTVPLNEALGARLAEPLTAKVTVPPAAVSAMDGYAVRLSDVTEPGAHLSVVGEIPAGGVFDGTLQPGQAARIFTGAEMPAGADHVVIQENAKREGDTVLFADAYTKQAHVRAAGQDFSQDEALIQAGQVIGPAELAIAAAANHASLNVCKRPRVAILANGDELRLPGSELSRGQIVNSNPPGLSALIRLWGGEPENLGIATDSIAAITAKIESASEADIIVPVGGASVGDHDHMRTAFSESGYESVFEKIAVRPGKPTWFARKGDQLVLGLPGNPASAFVCANLFLRILLTGETALPMHAAQVTTDLPANGPRDAFLRAVSALNTETAVRTVTPAANQDSSLIRPFLTADCLIHRPANAPAATAGDIIQTTPLTVR